MAHSYWHVTTKIVRSFRVSAKLVSSFLVMLGTSSVEKAYKGDSSLFKIVQIVMWCNNFCVPNLTLLY